MFTLASDKVFVTAYDNSIDALKPEWWANAGLMVLEEELVVANLVNRNYDNFFVNAGDTVHVSKPGTFTAHHKVQGSDTTVQDVTATDTLVKLNQHIETTVLLDDREVQQSIPNLFQYVLAPAMRGMAEKVDAGLVGETGVFHTNSAGTLGGGLASADLVELDRVFNANNVPAAGRRLVVGPTGKAALYGIDRFIDADKTGQDGKFLNGILGGVMGFDVYMSQTVGRELSIANTRTTETTNGGEVKGATSITVDAAGANHAAGVYVTIEGVPGIYRVASAVTSSDTEVVVTPGIRSAVGDGKTLTFWESAGDVKGDHAAGVIKIITDGYGAATDIPQVGQGLSFGAGTQVYTVTRVTGTYATSSTEITLELNRPLDDTVTNDSIITVQPTGGSYNWAFRSDAITMVNRPLAPAQAGVASAVQNNGSFALRVTIGYDMRKMRHVITLDTLFGVKVLDVAQGAVLFC